MNALKNREHNIRLGALKVRYRQAWKCKASSSVLAGLLSDIEKLEHSQTGDPAENAVRPVNGRPLCKPAH